MGATLRVLVLITVTAAWSCDLIGGGPGAARADPAEFCAKAGTDDTLRPYDRRLRPEFVRAYKRMFPKSTGVPSDPVLAATAVSRCMDGQLVACFAGDRLPCSKSSVPTADLDRRGFAKGMWTPLD